MSKSALPLVDEDHIVHIVGGFLLEMILPPGPHLLVEDDAVIIDLDFVILKIHHVFYRVSDAQSCEEEGRYSR